MWETDARDTVRGFQHVQWKENVGRFCNVQRHCRISAMHGPLTNANRRACANFVFSAKVRSSIWETPHRATPFSFKLWNFGTGLVSVTPFLILDSHPRFSLSVAKRRRAAVPTSVYILGVKRRHLERSSRTRQKREGRSATRARDCTLGVSSEREASSHDWLAPPNDVHSIRAAERLVLEWRSPLTALLGQVV